VKVIAADVYELVEEHFGEPASPELVLQVRTGARKDATDFATRYREWVRTMKPRVPSKTERQVRPFIEAAYYGPRGVSLFAPAFSADEDRLWALYDGLVHHLLYCHSVAVENPLMHLITSGRRLPLLSVQGGMLGFNVNPTIILARYMALLVELRDLVDCGAVVLVETGGSPTSGYASKVTVYREADPPGVGTYAYRDQPYVLSDAQFAGIAERVGTQLAERAAAELVRQYPEDNITEFMRQERRESLLRIALGKIARAARVSDRVGDLDLYLQNDFEQNALVAALAVAPEWLTRSPVPSSAYHQRQMRVLDRLLQLDLPDLSNLAPGDIRAIRAGDEIFNRWRQALSNGLSLVETPPYIPLTEQQLDAVRRDIYESIVEAGLAIDTTINKSDVMKAGRAGVVKLVLGLLSGGAAMPVVAADAGLATGKGLAKSAVHKMQQKPLAESLTRHTILFDTSQQVHTEAGRTR
jgi:hypothetical protein